MFSLKASLSQQKLPLEGFGSCLLSIEIINALSVWNSTLLILGFQALYHVSAVQSLFPELVHKND